MNMLRTDLPEIITETLPGPKAQAIIKTAKDHCIFRSVSWKNFDDDVHDI